MTINDFKKHVARLEARVKELETENANQRTGMDELDSTNSVVRSDNTRLKKEAVARETRISELEAEVVDKQQRISLQYAALKKELDVAHAKTTSLEVDNQQLHSKNRELLKQLNDNPVYAHLDKQNASMGAQVVEATDTVMRLEKDCADKDVAIEAHVVTIRRQSTELTESRRSLAEQIERVADVLAKLESLTHDHADLQKAHASVQAQLASAKQQAENNKTDYSRSQIECRQLLIDKKRLQDALHRVETRHPWDTSDKSLRAQITELQMSHDALQQTHINVKQQLDDAHAVIEGLRQPIAVDDSDDAEAGMLEATVLQKQKLAVKLADAQHALQMEKGLHAALQQRVDVLESDLNAKVVEVYRLLEENRAQAEELGNVFKQLQALQAETDASTAEVTDGDSDDTGEAACDGES